MRFKTKTKNAEKGVPHLGGFLSHSQSEMVGWSGGPLIRWSGAPHSVPWDPVSSTKRTSSASIEDC